MFENVMAELLRIEGVKGVAIVGKDGLIIESELADRSIDPELAAAMVAAAYGSGSSTMEKLLSGKTNMIMVEGENGKILLVDAGDKAMLSVFTESKVNLGLIRIEMRKAAEKIASSL
jgi:predicted regulator of Ras-like GTPase activity (Roadblock/LC7/MglB family)